MTNEYLADVLDEAAQLLDEKGWRCHQLIDDKSDGGEAMCLSGAVALASGHTVNSLRYHITHLGDDANDTHRAAMKEILDLVWGDHIPTDPKVVENWVAVWNDKTCEDGKEAQAILQKIAARLRERVE